MARGESVDPEISSQSDRSVSLVDPCSLNRVDSGFDWMLLPTLADCRRTDFSAAGVEVVQDVEMLDVEMLDAEVRDVEVLDVEMLDADVRDVEVQDVGMVESEVQDGRGARCRGAGCRGARCRGAGCRGAGCRDSGI